MPYGDLPDMKWMLVALSLSCVLSCGALSKDDKGTDWAPNETLIDEINQNIEKWNESGISTYSFKFLSLRSDCPNARSFPEVVISVEEGQVQSVFVEDFGAFEVDTSGWPTISELLETMLENSQTRYLSFAKSRTEPKELPVFNDLYGYPLTYYFDKSDSFCDAYNVIISEFQ